MPRLTASSSGIFSAIRKTIVPSVVESLLWSFQAGTGIGEYSPDHGETWTEVNTGTYNSLFLLTDYDSTMLLMNGGTTARRSTDKGITWGNVTVPQGPNMAGITDSWRNSVYNPDDGIMLVVPGGANGFGNAYTIWSDDGGATWTQGGVISSFSYEYHNHATVTRGLAYGNGVYMIVPSGNFINEVFTITNADLVAGNAWTRQDNVLTNDFWESLAYGEILGTPYFFAATQQNTVDGGGSRFAYSSNNGVTWTESSTALPGGFLRPYLAVGKNRVVLVGQPNTFGQTTSSGYYTDDLGDSWTEFTLPANAFWQAVIYADGVFVAVGYTGSGPSATSYTAISNDGATWTSTTNPTTRFGLLGFVSNTETVPTGLVLTGPANASYTAIDSGLFTITLDSPTQAQQVIDTLYQGQSVVGSPTTTVRMSIVRSAGGTIVIDYDGFYDESYVSYMSGSTIRVGDWAGSEFTNITDFHSYAEMAGGSVSNIAISRIEIELINDIPPSGEMTFLEPGTYTWTAPEGVTEVSAVAVGGGGAAGFNGGAGGGGGGLGYKNAISVTPGNTYTVFVGRGTGNGYNASFRVGSQSSYFIDTSTVAGLAGGTGASGSTVGGTGGSFVGDGGGQGGEGGSGLSAQRGGGGGGAGGYNGTGGRGGNQNGDGTAAAAGTGAGGGGAGHAQVQGGGGVGLFGIGNDGGSGTRNTYPSGTGGSSGGDGLTGYAQAGTGTGHVVYIENTGNTISGDQVTFSGTVLEGSLSPFVGATFSWLASDCPSDLYLVEQINSNTWRLNRAPSETSWQSGTANRFVVSNVYDGGFPGGGGGATSGSGDSSICGAGGHGAVRIIWGSGRSFPNAAGPIPDYTVSVVNSGSSAYRVMGMDRTVYPGETVTGKRLTRGNNRALTYTAGDLVSFCVNAPGHPFYIKTASSTGTGDQVSQGVTGQGTEEGTVYWDTTGVAPGTYYYQCSNHLGMNGEIDINP